MTHLTPQWIFDVLHVHASDVQVFMFGSSLKNPETAADIDLALVYPNGKLNQAVKLGRTLERRSPKICDILAISEAEEQELSFVESVDAVRIWPLPADTDDLFQ